MTQGCCLLGICFQNLLLWRPIKSNIKKKRREENQKERENKEDKKNRKKTMVKSNIPLMIYHTSAELDTKNIS